MAFMDSKLSFHTELHDVLVSAARSLQPLLEQNAALHDQTGTISDPVIEGLAKARLFDMATPRRLGGLCVNSITMTAVTYELAKSCPSTAWVLAIINSGAWYASRTPKRVQDYLFSDHIPRFCTPQNMLGTITKRANKYLVSGKWSYASGCNHAEFAICRASMPDAAVKVAVLPMSECRIERTWLVPGMRGTGSDTVVAENVEVPADAVCDASDLMQNDVGSSRGYALEATDYWVPIPLLRAKSMSVLVGAAEGLLRQIMVGGTRVMEKTTYKQKIDSHVFQAGIGESAAKIRAAYTLINRANMANDQAAIDRTILDYAQRAEYRGEAGVAAELLSYAVDKLMSLGGSSAFAQNKPAERFWRDFGVSSRHNVFNVDTSYEVLGRHLLSVEPNMVPMELI